MSIKICIIYAIFMLVWFLGSSAITNILKNSPDYDYLKVKNILKITFIFTSPFFIFLLIKSSLNKFGYEGCYCIENFSKVEKVFLDEFLDSVPCMVIIWKKDGTIKRVNPSTEKILGYNSNELIGKKWFEIYLPKYFRREKFLLYKEHDAEKVLSSLGVNKEFRVKAKCGKIIYTLWNSTLVKDEEGNITDIISVGTDITNRRKEEKKLHHLAYYDMTTKLPNRTNFERKVRKIIKENNLDFNFALIYLDIDNFKSINDTMGHLYGDMLLKEVASIIINEIKSPNLAARLGGDEFGIIIYQYESIEELEKYLNGILKSLKNPIIIDGNKVKVTISMGVSFYPKHGNNLTELLKKADRALYSVKQSGKNGFCFYG